MKTVTGLVIERKFELVVDYSERAEQLLWEGHYDDEARGCPGVAIVSDHFPPSPSGKVKVALELWYFGGMSFDPMVNVLAELLRRDVRPGSLHELLTVGRDRPDLQRQFPIIELGSIAHDWAIWIGSIDNRRVIASAHTGVQSLPDFRFLVLRKILEPASQPK